MLSTHVKVATGVLALVAATSLSACGSDDTSSAVSSSTSSSTSASSGSSEHTLTLTDGWAKAVDVSPASAMPSATSAAGSMGRMPMSAVFGTLTNPGTSPITVTGGSTSAAGRVELHETVMGTDGQMRMQPKAGGFVIPAAGSLVLRPGGNHIMLMGLTSSLRTGDTVPVTLTTSAGTVELTVPIRSFTGAQETYQAPTSS